MNSDNQYDSDNFEQYNENPFAEPNQQRDYPESNQIDPFSEAPYFDPGYTENVSEDNYNFAPYPEQNQNPYTGEKQNPYPEQGQNPYAGGNQLPYAEEYYDPDMQSGYVEDSLQEDAEKRKKIFVLIAILLAAIIVAVSLFFGIRALSGKKNHNKVQFERKEKDKEPSNLGALPIPEQSDSFEKPKVTVSVETSKGRRPSKMPSRVPSLTTQKTSKQTTTKKDIKVSEQTRKKETTQKQVANPTTKVTNTPAPKSTTAPTPKPTTTPTPKPTTAPTSKPTTALTTEPTTAPTTKQTTKSTQKPTESNTTATTQPTEKTQPSFPEPTQVSDYPKLPESIAPDTKLPDILNETEENMVISQDGKMKAKKAALSEHSFSIINENGEEVTFKDLEHSVNEVVAISKNYVYFTSDDLLVRMTISDKTESELSGLPGLSSAKYRTDLSGNLIITSEQALYIVPAQSTEAIKIGEDISDLKIQGNTIAYLANKKVYIVDLKSEIKEDMAKEIPQTEINSFALAVDGSALYFQKENSLYCYKAGLLYELSSDLKDFVLTDKADIALVLENSNQLNIIRVNDKIELIKNFKDVDLATINNNRKRNYNGNYNYADSSSKIIINFIDGKTEEFSLP